MTEKFFNDNPFYDNEMVVSYLKIKNDEARELIKNYADYTLGVEIYECLKKNGTCSFTAEL
jgi:hypothetical protein